MLAAIILSAGKSERMGEPKALLKYKGKTFLQNIIDSVKSAGAGDIFVVLGFGKEKIEPFVTGAKIIINPNPELGQFSSLKTGLKNIPSDADAVLIHLVDVPAVLPQTHKTVIETHKNNPEKIIIPYYKDRHGHPVIFPKKFFKGLLEYPIEKTARDFIHEQAKDNILNLEVTDAGILKDFDTKEDLL